MLQIDWVFDERFCIEHASFAGGGDHIPFETPPHEAVQLAAAVALVVLANLAACVEGPIRGSHPLALLLCASCGDVARSGRAPVYLVINSLAGVPGGGHGVGQPSAVLSSDVLVLVTSGGTCSIQNPCPTVYGDSGQAVLSLALKDVGTPSSPATPTSNNTVTVNRVHVEYRRTDGRNAPGVDVPYPFDGAATVTVPTGGGTVTMSFELVRVIAKEESPLVQLVNAPGIISTIAYVTFYGTDQVGNAVSATGTIQVDFADFGDV